MMHRPYDYGQWSLDMRVSIHRCTMRNGHGHQTVAALTEVTVSSGRTTHAEDRLVLPAREGVHLLAWSEIRYCMAESNYCSIYLEDDRRIFLAKTLKALFAELPGSEFFRPHRSYLINWHAVRMIHADRVVLHDGREIPVARSRGATIAAMARERFTVPGTSCG